MSHPGEPPAKKLTPVKVRKVEWVRKVKAAAKQGLHRAIINLLVVEEKIDRALRSARDKVVDLRRVTAEAHPSEEMSGVRICKSHCYHSQDLRDPLLNLLVGDVHWSCATPIHMTSVFYC